MLHELTGKFQDRTGKIYNLKGLYQVVIFGLGKGYSYLVTLDNQQIMLKKLN